MQHPSNSHKYAMRAFESQNLLIHTISQHWDAILESDRSKEISMCLISDCAFEIRVRRTFAPSGEGGALLFTSSGNDDICIAVMYVE